MTVVGSDAEGSPGPASLVDEAIGGTGRLCVAADGTASIQTTRTGAATTQPLAGLGAFEYQLDVRVFGQLPAPVFDGRRCSSRSSPVTIR